MNRKTIFILPGLFFFILGIAQNTSVPDGKSSYWQQHLDYSMDVDVDVKHYRYTGKQSILYTNNSPDTLYNIYYHLYYNAFQPGSAMDERLKSIPDPDHRMVIDRGKGHSPRYESRISGLREDEIGYIRPSVVKQDGVEVSYIIRQTIMRVQLQKPIPPGGKSTLQMDYTAQIPVMIRRTGRNNKDGIALSMTQWYPKPAVYDRYGWHTDPYIGREFYGEWANFDLYIHIDKDYTVGGTGILQNPQETGHGYEKKGVPPETPKGDKITWHFTARNVHDFAWMADDDVIHDQIPLSDGSTLIHFIYKNEKKNRKVWKKMQAYAVRSMEFYNELVGKYPFAQYSVLQGGDGGMEYPMCTLISGNRNFNSLTGTMMHEMAHEWFYFLLASNESEYPWMDEGFTSFIEYLASANIRNNKPAFIFDNAYKYYYYLVSSGQEEPACTHSDRYKTNMAYGINAYDRGVVFLAQLGYITGMDTLIEILQKYFEQWKFKHPYPEDFMRVAEKVSGMELDWYYNEFMQTTHHVDYKVEDVKGKHIILRKEGMIPMPLEVYVLYTDNTEELFYIPLDLTLTEKQLKATRLPVWYYGADTYEWDAAKDIKRVYIDPGHQMADINLHNNVYVLSK